MCLSRRWGAEAVIIPAISLRQPWASLAAVGARPFIIRGRPAGWLLGMRVALHAERYGCVGEFDQATTDAITDALGGFGWNYWLPRHAIVCTGILTESVPIEDFESCPFGIGDCIFGEWIWRLGDIRPITPAVRAKKFNGRRDFWRWTVPEGVSI